MCMKWLTCNLLQNKLFYNGSSESRYYTSMLPITALLPHIQQSECQSEIMVSIKNCINVFTLDIDILIYINSHGVLW